MGTDPEQLRRDIEQTRQEMSYDADALTEKVSPSRIVDRRVSRVKGAMSNARDNVMGSASDTSDTASARMSGLASNMTDGTSGLAGTAKSKAQGNPLAAGLIAFGGGWLLSALLPASDREQRAAGQLTDAVKEHAEPVKQELTQMAGEMKDNLQEPAQQAVQSVKDTATDAASTVKQEGQSAAGGVKDDATAAGQNVRQQQQSDDPQPPPAQSSYPPPV